MSGVAPSAPADLQPVTVLSRERTCPGVRSGRVAAYEFDIPETLAVRPGLSRRQRAFLLLDESVQLAQPQVFPPHQTGWWYVDLVASTRPTQPSRSPIAISTSSSARPVTRIACWTWTSSARHSRSARSARTRAHGCWPQHRHSWTGISIDAMISRRRGRTSHQPPWRLYSTPRSHQTRDGRSIEFDDPSIGDRRRPPAGLVAATAPRTGPRRAPVGRARRRQQSQLTPHACADRASARRPGSPLPPARSTASRAAFALRGSPSPASSMTRAASSRHRDSGSRSWWRSSRTSVVTMRWWTVPYGRACQGVGSVLAAAVDLARVHRQFRRDGPSRQRRIGRRAGSVR
jgi:hypothetical protein